MTAVCFTAGFKQLSNTIGMGPGCAFTTNLMDPGDAAVWCGTACITEADRGDPIGFGRANNIEADEQQHLGNVAATIGLMAVQKAQEQKPAYDPSKTGPADPTNPSQPLFKNKDVQKHSDDAFARTTNGKARDGLAEAGFAIDYKNGKISFGPRVDSVTSDKPANESPDPRRPIHDSCPPHARGQRHSYTLGRGRELPGSELRKIAKCAVRDGSPYKHIYTVRACSLRSLL